MRQQIDHTVPKVALCARHGLTYLLLYHRYRTFFDTASSRAAQRLRDLVTDLYDTPRALVPPQVTRVADVHDLAPE